MRPFLVSIIIAALATQAMALPLVWPRLFPQQLDNPAMIGTDVRPACRIGIETIATKRGCTFMRNGCWFVNANTIGILIISVSAS
jgi:hypothetical protein